MSVEEREDLVARLRAILRPDSDNGELDVEARDAALVAALEGVHPADIAEAMNQLADANAMAIFRVLDNARAAETLDELDPDTARYLLDNDVPGRIADLLDLLPMDDAAEVLAEMQESNPEQAEELLETLEQRSPEDAAEVRELLSYREQTAGRLMTDKFIRVTPEMPVEQAFVAIREADPDIEALSDLYVVERTPSGREVLYGVLDLRTLIRAEPNTLVESIMVHEPVSVTVDTDQEEVAQIISKYDLNAVPVIDRQGALAGIVTVDDVVDILEEEQTEDALKQGAVIPDDSGQPYFAMPILRVVRNRITWLLLLFVGGIATTSVLGGFSEELDHLPLLAVFIPLLIGTGGNTGAQTVSTVIRALSLKEIRWRDTGRVLIRELGSGMLLGLLLGVIAFTMALFLRQSGLQMAFVVGLTVFAICIWSNTIGALIPLVAQRFNIDPALISAPLITTLVDATGLAIYLGIAKLLLDALRH